MQVAPMPDGALEIRTPVCRNISVISRSQQGLLAPSRRRSCGRSGTSVMQGRRDESSRPQHPIIKTDKVSSSVRRTKGWCRVGGATAGPGEGKRDKTRPRSAHTYSRSLDPAPPRMEAARRVLEESQAAYAQEREELRCGRVKRTVDGRRRGPGEIHQTYVF